MKWKVLVTAPYMQDNIDRFLPTLREHGAEAVVPGVQERMEEAALLHWVHDVDGVICGDDRFTRSVLEAAPRLKVISKWGTGVDSIDQVACGQLGIALYNTPDAFSGPVADTVMGYLLCFARGLLVMDRAMKGGMWTKVLSKALSEYTLGVIGVGNVGKRVVRRAASFGMKILGHDLVAPPAEFLRGACLEMVSKEALLEASDFVSLNCTLNPRSYHIIGRAEFERMKPTAVLINTARGPLIDEPNLIDALKVGRIGGAALDVFEEEPLPPSSALRSFDNVLLAAHNANSSPEAWERVHWNTIQNLLKGLERNTR